MNCGNLPSTFKDELRKMANKMNRPVIYFQHWTKDGFIDNTKDYWRRYDEIINKDNMLDELIFKARQNENKLIFNNVIEELNEKNRKKNNRKYYYKREWAKKRYVFNNFDAFYKKYITIRNCERCDDYFGSFCNTRGRNSRQVLHVGGGINMVVCRVCLDIWEADW